MIFEIVTINDIKLSIAKICRQKRESQKLSRDELAALLNLSRNTIQNIELGKNATIDNLLKVAYHLDLLIQIKQGLLLIDPTHPDNSIPKLY